jgi:hypothetical protein
MESPSEQECKLRFAYYMHKCNGRPYNAMTALMDQYGYTDANFATTYMKKWQFDAEVEAEITRLASIVKTKEQHLRDIQEARNKALTDGDYKAVSNFDRLYADVAGFIKKVNASDKNEGTEDNLAELAWAVQEPTLSDTVIVEVSKEDKPDAPIQS